VIIEFCEDVKQQIFVQKGHIIINKLKIDMKILKNYVSKITHLQYATHYLVPTTKVSDTRSDVNTRVQAKNIKIRTKGGINAKRRPRYSTNCINDNSTTVIRAVIYHYRKRMTTSKLTPTGRAHIINRSADSGV